MSRSSESVVSGAGHAARLGVLFAVLLVGSLAFESWTWEPVHRGLWRAGAWLIALAPLFVALLLCELGEGPSGTRALVGRAVRWRAPAGVWAVALVAPLVVVAGGLLAVTAGGATLRDLTQVHSSRWTGGPTVVSILVTVFAFEVAWRGFALEPYRGTRRFWPAAVVLGGVAALVFLSRPSTYVMEGFSVATIALAALGVALFQAWLYRGAEGGVVPGWLSLCVLLVAVTLADLAVPTLYNDDSPGRHFALGCLGTAGLVGVLLLVLEWRGRDRLATRALSEPT